MSKSDEIILKGTCADDYQSVKDLFQSHLETGKDENAQLCVFADGKCVVDLWGSSIGDEKFGPDNLQVVCSSGKSVAAFVVAMMVEQGLLDYEEKVSKYWPEFGQEGKEDLTLADVLRHEAGLDTFDEAITIDVTHTDRIKENALGSVIERSASTYTPNTLNKDGTASKRAYHGLTRGFILNEVVRRVEPSGRTIGQIIREDVGIQGIRCGLTEEELKQVAPQRIPSLWQFIKLNLSGAGYMNFKTLVVFVLYLIFVLIPKNIFNPKSKKAHFKELGDGGDNKSSADITKFLFLENLRKGEAISFNGHASARGMATLGAMIANKGAPPTDGSCSSKRLISEETFNKMHGNPKKAADIEIMGMVTNFTQGGVAIFSQSKSGSRAMNARDGYVGWMGLGGSVFQWHPELKIGFAYVPSLLQTFDFENSRGAFLQEEVKKCAENLQKNL